MKLIVDILLTILSAGISIVGYFNGIDYSPTIEVIDHVRTEVSNFLKMEAPNIEENTALGDLTIMEKHLSKKFDAAFDNDFDQLVENKMDGSDDTWNIPKRCITYFPWPLPFWTEIREDAIADDIANDFSKKCPAPYFNFGGGCIVILPFKKVTWVEARDACETYNGTLFTFRKKTHYKSLRYTLRSRVDYINDDDKHFWIGGHINSDGNLGSSKWTWIDNTVMEIKSPVWGVYKEERCNATNKWNYSFYFGLVFHESRKGDCLTMDNDFDFFFSDQSCLEKRYPICLLKED